MPDPQDLLTTAPTFGEKTVRWSIPIFRAKPKIPVTLWLTSSSWSWVDCHFWGGRHVPCLLRFGDCVCQTASHKVWKIGWGAVLPNMQERQGMFAVTKSMLEYAPELQAGNIRGALIECRKEFDDKPKSHNILRVVGHREASKPLPQPLDVPRWLSDQLHRKHMLFLAMKARGMS